MAFLGDLGRTVFGALYDYRLAVAIAAAALTVAVALIAPRRGWLAAARRHRGRTAVVVGLALAMGLPVAWYLGSPLFIRTALVEPEPVLVVPTLQPTATSAIPSPTVAATGSPPPDPTSTPAPTPAPTSFQPAVVSGRVLRLRRLPFRTGHRLDHRDATRPLPAPARGLLRPQRARPVRLPVTGGRWLCRRRPGARQAQGDGWLLRLRPAGRRRSGGLRERRHLVQAVRPPVRDGTLGRGLSPVRIR